MDTLIRPGDKVMWMYGEERVGIVHKYGKILKVVMDNGTWGSVRADGTHPYDQDIGVILRKITPLEELL